MHYTTSMVEVVFEAHALTYDNENRISSGFADVDISIAGERNCKDLAKRYKNVTFDAIICSDLKRSYQTAELAFGNRFSIVKDKRLRECDYGKLTRHSADEVEAERTKRIYEPFPGGESYEQAFERISDSLKDILETYDGKRVMIIGHGATWRALEHLLNGKPLEVAVRAKHKWQPGWQYKLSKAA